MNELQTMNPTQFSATLPFSQDTGLGWEYIRIINNSPYLLRVTLGNQGTLTVPEMWLEDIAISQKYNGKLTIAPIVNISPANVNGSLSSLVSINTFSAGEITTPRSQPLGTPAGIGKAGQTVDAVLEAFPSVDITITTPQTFPLTAQFLNLAGVSAQNPGYLILGYLDCDSGRATFKNTRGNKEPLSLSQTVTIPASSIGNIQVFTLASPANYLTCLMFQGLSAGLNIANVEVKRGADPVASYQGIIVGANLTATTTINVANIYAPDGFTNFVGAGGINIRLTSNNSGAQASYTMYVFGYQLAYDEAEYFVSYTDWLNNIYDLGVGRVGQNLLLPLNFLVPIAITDPLQTNFGSLTIQVSPSQSYYNSHYTFDTFIPCVVTQLAE